MTTLQMLEKLHKDIGQVAGEICMSLTLYRIVGGKTAVSRWIYVLRKAADELEEWSNGPKA